MCKKEKDRNWGNLNFKRSKLTWEQKNSKFYCNHLTRWIEILYGNCKIFRGLKCIFWLRYLNFGRCIEDPINKSCWKNGKDQSNGLLKLNFETIPKKTHFPVFAKNFRWPWMKVTFFFANFQILGPLGCQGWVVIPQNVKKVKITAPYCTVPHSVISSAIYSSTSAPM